MPALVPTRPGPRRAHKLTEQALTHAEELLAADPSLRPADLVEPLSEQFGVCVHPRSIERALGRRRSRKSHPAAG